MKNTGKIYTSTEKSPIVAQEFAELLPPLGAEQLAVLEADILANGCYAPIIVDENFTVIDGHNRLSICHTHSIPFQMLVFAFADKLEAKQWALDTQKGRRNLDKWELGKIALKLKPEVEARAKANQSAAGGNKYVDETASGNVAESGFSVDTRKELADSVGLGERTMGKVMQIDEHAPTAVKEALDKKELSINQGYNITQQVRQLPEEEQDEAARMAVEYEKMKKEIKKADAETDRRSKIAKVFCKAFECAVAMEVTEENVRIWTECTRMRPDEMEYSVLEAR